MSYQLGAELLNFGAFIGFMGVNIAAFVRYYVRAEQADLPQPGAAPDRFRHLRLHLVESPPYRQAGRRGLACRRAPLRRLENQGISPPGRVRRAGRGAGVMIGYLGSPLRFSSDHGSFPARYKYSMTRYATVAARNNPPIATA